MNHKSKSFISVILVLAIFLIGLAFTPLLVLADDIPFTWETYSSAYQDIVSIFLPLILR